MRIAFIALWSPTNIKYWSGTPHYSYNAIRKVIPDIVLLDTPRLDRFLFYAGKVSRRLGLDLLREPLVLSLYKRLINRMLIKYQPDIVISVGASHKLFDIDQNVRIIHVADALFATIIEFYENMSQITARSKALGDDVQRRFLEKVDVLCLSSDWAIDSAKSHYGLQDCDLRVLPLGANLSSDPGFDQEARFANQKLSFLFIGGDWERKGGPLLLEAFQVLKARHPDAELHIIGCTPSIDPKVSDVHVHGFLSKTDAQDAKTLNALFRTSAFLFVPSRQEAFGIVYCEACAYGLPPVATETGGVGTIVMDGENGILLGLQENAAAYCDKITDLWKTREAYKKMCQTARQHYEERLSWSGWANGIASEAKRLAAKAGE